MHGKVFALMYKGSMIGAGLAVFAVWAYALANVDAHGLVELNPVLLAAIFGCKPEEVRKAIDYLCQPDSRSRHQPGETDSVPNEARTACEEGRRLKNHPRE